ncbi:MAG: hypothetical protein IJS44_03645 [Clostridia bacterium]|nr:hypothetical protein [Clostridia bacterium]
MKKLFLMFVLSALLLLPALAAENIVYVSDGGEGDGATAQTPLGSLSAAYAALGDAGGRIVITDTCTLSAHFTEPAHSGKVTLTGGKLSVAAIRYILNGATTFEQMEIHGSGKYMLLIAQYNPVELGEGVAVTGFGDFSVIAQSLTILGGVQFGADKYKDTTLDSKNPSITVKSGKALIIGFSRQCDRAFTGTATINISGGEICNVYAGAVTGSGGNAVLNVTGGRFIHNMYTNANTNSALGGSYHATISAGDFSAITMSRLDGSVLGENNESILDVRGLDNYSALVEKAEGFTKIITDEGELTPQEKVDMQETFLYGNFTASSGAKLPYRYYLPEGYDENSDKTYPVFLYMHGNGSRGTNNTAQLNLYCLQAAVYNSSYECIILAPQCPSAPNEWTLYNSIDKQNGYPGGDYYAAFLESGQPYGSKYFCAAVELLDQFLNTYRIDTSRVYLGGGSNGGGAVWNFLTLYPEVFAAAVPIAGSHADPDYAHSIAHRMKDVPIWTFHGDNDASVPVEGTRTMVAALRELNANITYTEVPGGDHGNIWRIASNATGLMDWIFAQRNENFKNTLSAPKGPALPAPENLRWNIDSAAWDAVEGAGAYKVTVYVDGTPVKTTFTPNTFYAPDFADLGAGDCTFTVRAFPQNNEYSVGAQSAQSEPYTVDLSTVADFDGDGKVSLADALTLLRGALGGTAPAGGDLNGDGKVGVADVIRLLKYIAEQK